MPFFSHLVRFECEEDGADLGPHADGPPSPGTKLDAVESLDELANKEGKRAVTVSRMLTPLPRNSILIYCVGLNYRSHAKEAKLAIPYPPLWTKPAASLAQPDQDIAVNDFCAKSLLDYESELVFVTSKECRDVSPKDGKDYILGYTVGNDLSCRTTIPAGMAVMTGTLEGVGAFRKPKSFLQHGDVVEIEMQKVETLKNKINFE